MQTFGLPRQITRGAALASRLCGKERSDEAHRRDALERWRQARADGLTARAAANAVGVPRSTLYRWRRLADRNRLKPCSRRPHTPRRPAWPAALVTAVRETRADYPMWGKAKIVVLLRRNGHAASESTTGRASWDLPDDDLDDINRWIDAFTDEFNTFRPHQALGGHTPAQYLHSLTAKETPVSHMS